ncbi:MAG: cell surface protein SprA [Saprospiraceae bacterium]|nr:cell surface protein SprA [Saprospiraceae bacterium]
MTARIFPRYINPIKILKNTEGVFHNPNLIQYCDMNKKGLLHNGAFVKLILLGFSLLNATTSEAKTTLTDTIPLRDRAGDYLRDSVVHPFNLSDPTVINKTIEFDPLSNQYNVTEKVGDDFYYRAPTVMTYDEYLNWKAKQQEREYFERLAGLSKRKGGDKIDPMSRVDFSATQNSKLKMLLKSVGVNGKLPEVPKLDIKKMGDNLIGMIFGDPPTVDIRPQGQIDLTLGGDYRYYGNPILPTYARRTGGLLFNMDIQMNVTGKIGEKLNLNTAFNNKATFDFDNLMKINYNSNVFSEDDIIKSIEGGNVNLPLRGTLIQGSQNLFGVKTELQFGYLRLTAIAAQQRNRRQNLAVQGGSQVQNFNVPIDQYDENRHFFLTHFNRNTFEKALKELPLVNSLFSIDKIEVWVSNERNEDREVRQIVALADLGEPTNFNNPQAVRRKSTAKFSNLDNQYLPDNNANDLYERLQNDAAQTRRINTVIRHIENNYGLVQGQDFIKRSAKRLQPSEYQFNPKLGTLSINNVDRQQVLGVSFTYFYNGQGPFQVGEFGQDVAATSGSALPGGDSISQVLFVKLLKNTIQNPVIPLYDLMMKNVYSVGAYVTNPQDLRLDIVYQDVSAEKADKRSLPELSKIPLLTVLNLDRLNQVGDPQPDGQFDFIPDVTINTRNGRIMFPKLEPFGSSMTSRLTELGMDPSVIQKYIYQELYDSTLFRAQERQEKNRFIIRGQVKSTASNRIQLNAFGLRPGAVTVTAGSFQLLEGVDYAIDYGTSTLTILNPAYVAPNIPLNVSYEDNALFGFQTRTMLGVRADYKVNKNFNVGATFMNLFEIPYTRKVNFGDDPINNKVYGADINFTEDAPWLTKLVDKLPFIETKEPSKITVSAEAAVLQPGHSKAIEGPKGDCTENGGIVYLDDFEGSSSPFSLMAQPNAWQIASVPQKNRLFPESSADSVLSGVNRALLNWYRIDQFVRERGSAADKANTDPCTAAIGQTEVFPNRDPLLNGGFSNFLPTFDLSYYPSERGPYNFDAPPGASRYPYSAGIRGDGNLNAPATRWAGVMRGLTTTDFEQANVEYVDFWLLDPFLKDQNPNENPGTMYIHLGDISEDILRDGRKAYENGLPSSDNPNFKIDRTPWGIVPRTEIPLPNSFSASEEARKAQDLGLDGMTDADETSHYQNWLSKFSPIPAKVASDPANDNFTYYNDEAAYANGTDVLTRYKRFNGLQGNAASNSGFQVQSATNLPDAEDINRDNSFEENEAYFSYKIPISRDYFSPTTNKYYIENTPDPNGSGRIWHHFRVPIDAFDSKHGAINDFRSIRFMRLIVKDFEKPVCLRFAKLDLIRNQWRRYKRPLSKDGVDVLNRADLSAMELVSVNLEENSKKFPFNYVIPPCIQREVIPNAFAANARQNEQSLGVRMQNILPNVPKAAFKLFSSDMRIYERLKMFIHAEQPDGGVTLNDKMSVFMRIGSDFERNYYEYEIPLKMSDITKLPASNTSEEYKNEVWLKDNSFDFPLSILTKIKVERNAQNADLTKVYAVTSSENPNHKVKIIGNPDIGTVKGIMVGVYNNDRVPHDLEMWINELRMTGLNENAGGAAIARVDMKMADFGNLSVSGNYLGIGYGAIDQRVTQRSREQVTEYALNGNFELGKFFNQKIGLHVPFNVQYSNNTRTPEFDPYDLDIKLKEKLQSETNGEKRQEIKDAAQTVQIIKGYSFNNVRKDRTGASERKPAPWDIENFAVSYANTTVDRHDPLVESDAKLSKKGSLDYNYSREPLYVTPFKKLVKNPKVEKYTKLITEMNFNPIPNNVGFNTILDRQLNITKYRFSGDDDAFNTFYIRRFSWDRNYNLQWDLTRSLKLNYDAKNFSIVDELPDYDQLGAPVDPDAQRKFLNNNLKNFGRAKRYDHNINVNYTVPMRNIPYLDWIQLRGTYTASYGWEAAALGFESIGNNINNKQSRQVNADMNFTQFYNQFKYLRKIQEPLFKPTVDKKNKRATKPGVTLDPSVKKLPDLAAASDTTKGKKKKKEQKEYEPSGAEKILIRPLLLLRNARLNYTEQYYSFVPGFTPQARMFGMSDLSKPGWDYVLGYHQADENWLDDAGARSWISRDIRQVRPTLNNYSQQIDARVTVEPFTDFRVDIDLTKNYVKNQSQEYRVTDSTGGPLYHNNRFDEGSYNISYFTLNTLFSNINDVFNTFSNNREVLSQILGAGQPIHPEFPTYRQGFGPTNQDVVVPAFIAAYTGRNVTTSNRNLFNERPSVNWRLSYNGLAKLPGLKNTFNNISITHGYKSSLTVNSYRTSQFYDVNQPTKPRIGSPYEYYSQYDIPVIAITEQFSPLLGIDMSFKTGANFGMQYRKSRNLGLSLSDTRLQETKTSEIQVKFGHRIKNVYIKALDINLDGAAKKKPVKKKDEDLTTPSGDPTADPKAKKKKEPKAKKGNDLVLNFDLSFRDDITENHLLGQGTDVPSRGSKTIRVSPSATYTINKRLDLRFYVDYNHITPYTTAAFPSTTATGGFVVTFKLN